ncbi:MAG: hypothetical protein UU59_C0001G0058 [candidate division WWE3 bacterium GW2011_GWE1_41_27]|uniref:Uncharacterized protein n=3 Tax=Katanobacteria TaxID=422282 RepID=A0A0G0W4N3_UNCKA|nr:MAG: hypothetical protein UU59_C0001G0058 [candidate division WWE3 bacterium GW2011_GWE1_41_27]
MFVQAARSNYGLLSLLILLNLVTFSLYNSYMPKNLKKKTYTLYSLHLPILIAIFAVIAGGAYLISGGPVDGTPQVQGTKTQKITRSLKNLLSKKGEESASSSMKATVSVGNTGDEHIKIVKQVSKELKTVADTEKGKGNEEVSDELTTIAEEQEATAEETAEVLEEVVNEPKWKTVLVGPDYKNLGQLRSTLSHNTNAIRKLIRTTESLGVGGTSPALQTSLTLLNEQRATLISVIKAGESQFSILGWVSKLLSGYTPAPIEDDVGDETEGTDSSAPSDELEGIGETEPSSSDTTETGTTEPGSGETETPESNPGSGIEIPSAV